MAKSKILIYAIVFELLYLFIFFLSLFKQFIGDTSYPAKNSLAAIFFIVWLIITSLIYIVFYLATRNQKNQFKKYFKVLILSIVIFSITLFVVWPIGSTDVFGYIYKSKI